MLAHRHFAIFALRHGLPFTPGHELSFGCPVKERWERNLLTLCFSFGGLICLEIIFIISFHKYVILYIYVWLAGWLAVWLSGCLSVWLAVWLSGCLAVCLSVNSCTFAENEKESEPVSQKWGHRAYLGGVFGQKSIACGTRMHLRDVFSGFFPFLSSRRSLVSQEWCCDEAWSRNNQISGTFAGCS